MFPKRHAGGGRWEGEGAASQAEEGDVVHAEPIRGAGGGISTGAGSGDPRTTAREFEHAVTFWPTAARFCRVLAKMLPSVKRSSSVNPFSASATAQKNQPLPKLEAAANQAKTALCLADCRLAKSLWPGQRHLAFVGSSRNAARPAFTGAQSFRLQKWLMHHIAHSPNAKHQKRRNANQPNYGYEHHNPPSFLAVSY
jgi:hypothetical protein